MSNKIGLITGAAHRIGRGIAEHFLNKGYHLFLHASSSFADLAAFKAHHPLGHHIIDIFQADFTNFGGVQDLAKSVLAHGVKLDLIIHNASLYFPKAFDSVTKTELHNTFMVNLDAPFFLTQALLPCLRASDNPNVINIIDALWLRPSKNFSHYASSRAALVALTKAMGKELAPEIRVNAVAPGLILFQDHQTEDYKKTCLDLIPLQRNGTIEDIAYAIDFLAHHAPYITGEILSVDGGRSIGS